MSSLKSLGRYLITFVVIALIIFVLPRLMPGDPLDVGTGEDHVGDGQLPEAQIQQFRDYYNLDAALPVQLATYSGRLLTGDLGHSLRFNQPVTDLIAERLPWTIGIVLPALALAAIVGVSIGIASATARPSRANSALYYFLLLLSETPGFLIGIALVVVFGVVLGWFPLAGGSTLFTSTLTPAQRVADWAHHATLPIAALATAQVGSFYLVARASARSVVTRDYVRTAVAKGIGPHQVRRRHVLRNAAGPIIARLFTALSILLSGVVLIEVVFNYLGVGQLLTEAIKARDYQLIQGIVLVLAVFIQLFSATQDILLRRLDPIVALTGVERQG